MTTDEQDRIAIQDNIDEFGCQIMEILGDNYIPASSYSIGFFQQAKHPEVICFGLSQEVLQTLLNNVKDRIEDGQTLEAGKTYKGFLGDDVEVAFIEVNKIFYDEYLEYAKWFYGNTDFPVLQLVWPDKKQHFPWDIKFDKQLEHIQPLLDRNNDFWFYESKKLGVFATKQVLEGATVKYVIHDEEGDWFFLEDEDADYDDLEMTSLIDIVKTDPTLNSIYYLQYGWEAYRENKGDEWEEQESDLE